MSLIFGLLAYLLGVAAMGMYVSPLVRRRFWQYHDNVNLLYCRYSVHYAGGACLIGALVPFLGPLAPLMGIPMLFPGLMALARSNDALKKDPPLGLQRKRLLEEIEGCDERSGDLLSDINRARCLIMDAQRDHQKLQLEKEEKLAQLVDVESRMGMALVPSNQPEGSGNVPTPAL